MILTEEEARKKWCPEVRTSCDERPISGNHAANRCANGQPTDRHCCIASECMAWRWDYDFSSQTEEGHGGDIVLRLKRLKGQPKRGYCGKAGKP